MRADNVVVVFVFVGAFVAVGSLAACAHAPAQGVVTSDAKVTQQTCAARATKSTGSARSAPILERINPDSVPMSAMEAGGPVFVVLEGCGFDATSNVVTFGRMSMPGLASSDNGTRLRLPVPVQLESTTEVPPMRIQPGPYQINVTNTAGRTDSRVLTIY